MSELAKVYGLSVNCVRESEQSLMPGLPNCTNVSDIIIQLHAASRLVVTNSRTTSYSTGPPRITAWYISLYPIFLL